MTTILLDVKTKKLYADKRTTYSHEDYGFDEYTDGNLKIHKDMGHTNVAVYTGSGCVANLDAFRRGSNPVSMSDTKAFHIEYSQESKIFTVVEAVPAKVKVLSWDYFLGKRYYWKKYAYVVTDCLTSGSGSRYALGAYLSGYPAERIIPDIVAQLDVNTSSDQNVFNFKTGKFE